MEFLDYRWGLLAAQKGLWFDPRNQV
jgi:hypothetical protein